MKKIFFILSILLGFVFLPLNTAFAQKWHNSFLAIYMPKNSAYTEMMTKAVNEWQTKIGKKMALVITTMERDLPKTDVDITFNGVIGEEATNSGSVQFSASTYYFRHAKIYINANETPEILNDEVKNKENQDEIYAVMLKTMGLTFGLPENDDPQSVMYKEYQKGQTILQSDVNNLFNIYNWSKPYQRASHNRK